VYAGVELLMFNALNLIDASPPALLIGPLRDVAGNLITYRVAVFDGRRCWE
jgi:hypothetical protein